jgi:hypothetical protein
MITTFLFVFAIFGGVMAFFAATVSKKAKRLVHAVGWRKNLMGDILPNVRMRRKITLETLRNACRKKTEFFEKLGFLMNNMIAKSP